MLSNRKYIFGIIFIIGLFLCLLSEELFSNTPISNVNALVFSAIIAAFGGGGLLLDIFKK
jgi:hypothetical protein